jgi:predicted secreted protein
MTKYAARGAILAVATVGAPTVFTTIPGVKDFSLSIGSPNQIDVTSHDSAGNYEEFVSGTIATNDVSIPLVWDGANAQHAALQAALQAGTSLNYKITGRETSPKIYTFTALVTGLEISWPLKGAQEATLTLKPSGAIAVA